MLEQVLCGIKCKMTPCLFGDKIIKSMSIKFLENECIKLQSLSIVKSERFLLELMTLDLVDDTEFTVVHIQCTRSSAEDLGMGWMD